MIHSPADGRWTAKDPIGFNGGVNAYVYVNNAPVSHIDAAGLFVGFLGVGGQSTVVAPPGFRASVYTQVVVGTDGKACTIATVCIKVGVVHFVMQGSPVLRELVLAELLTLVVFHLVLPQT